jgi:hypothetical protein
MTKISPTNVSERRKRGLIPPAQRLAARLASQRGLSLPAISFVLEVPVATVRSLVAGWAPVPGQNAAEAEERLRLVALAEIGIRPDHRDAAKFWTMAFRHAEQLLLVAAEAELVIRPDEVDPVPESKPVEPQPMKKARRTRSATTSSTPVAAPAPRKRRTSQARP